MTDAKREDKLNPAQSGRSDLPPGKLRSISMDETDSLQVDRTIVSCFIGCAQGGRAPSVSVGADRLEHAGQTLW